MGYRKNLSVEVGSIFVFSAGIFLLLSLATYQASDPSILNSEQLNFDGSLKNTLSNSLAVLNACGPTGAYASSWIFTYFGMGGFLVPFSFIYLAASMSRCATDLQKGVRAESVGAMGALGALVFAVGSMTVLFALHRRFWEYGGSTLLTGGVVGTWAGDILLRQFNLSGSSIIALLVLNI